MTTYKVNFNYYDEGIIVKSDSMDYQTILEEATTKKVNKRQFHGIYTYEEVCKMLDDEGLNFNDNDVYDKFTSDNNLYYLDLSCNKLRNKKQWIYWVNMDYVSINEVNTKSDKGTL